MLKRQTPNLVYKTIWFGETHILYRVVLCMVPTIVTGLRSRYIVLEGIKVCDIVIDTRMTFHQRKLSKVF